MSNKSILDRLLEEADSYARSRKNRDAFSKRVHDSVEALEGVPYAVRQECRDWQYKIETEGYFEEEGFESENQEVIPEFRAWVNELINKYS